MVLLGLWQLETPRVPTSQPAKDDRSHHPRGGLFLGNDAVSGLDEHAFPDAWPWCLLIFMDFHGVLVDESDESASRF